VVPALGVVFNAPVDVIFSDTQTVQPDLLVVRKSRASRWTSSPIRSSPELPACAARSSA
jgi:hypothetical protein